MQGTAKQAIFSKPLGAGPWKSIPVTRGKFGLVLVSYVSWLVYVSPFVPCSEIHDHWQEICPAVGVFNTSSAMIQQHPMRFRIRDDPCASNNLAGETIWLLSRGGCRMSPGPAQARCCQQELILARKWELWCRVWWRRCLDHSHLLAAGWSQT